MILWMLSGVEFHPKSLHVRVPAELQEEGERRNGACTHTPHEEVWHSSLYAERVLRFAVQVFSMWPFGPLLPSSKVMIKSHSLNTHCHDWKGAKEDVLTNSELCRA